MKSVIVNSRKPIFDEIVYTFNRQLQSSSQVFVKVGDEIRPETILHSDLVRSGFRTFNLAEMFKVKEIETEKLLKRTVGARVYQGDILAAKRDVLGFRERVFKSPLNGVIQAYDLSTGRLTMQYLPREVKTIAGVFGRVTEILPGEIISIATLADIVNGLITFGVDREGSLVEVGYPDIPLQPDQITEKFNGRIIYGGTKASLDVMYKALAVGVKMVITGGVDYQDYLSLRGTKGRLEDVGVSLVATEGFITAPIYTPVYDLLKRAEDRHVIFNAESGALVIPKESRDLRGVNVKDMPTHGSDKARGYTIMRLNDTVRIIFGEYAGEYGIVTDIQNQQIRVKLPNMEVSVDGEIVEVIESGEILNTDGKRN